MSLSRLNRTLYARVGGRIPKSCIPSNLFDSIEKALHFLKERLSSIDFKYGPLKGDLKRWKDVLPEAEKLIEEHNGGSPNYEREHVLASLQILNIYNGYKDLLEAYDS